MIYVIYALNIFIGIIIFILSFLLLRKLFPNNKGALIFWWSSLALSLSFGIFCYYYFEL